jgi:hypothetical protein
MNLYVEEKWMLNICPCGPDDDCGCGDDWEVEVGISGSVEDAGSRYAFGDVRVVAHMPRGPQELFLTNRQRSMAEEALVDEYERIERLPFVPKELAHV